MPEENTRLKQAITESTLESAFEIVAEALRKRGDPLNLVAIAKVVFFCAILALLLAAAADWVFSLESLHAVLIFCCVLVASALIWIAMVIDTQLNYLNAVLAVIMINTTANRLQRSQTGPSHQTASQP